MMEDKIDSEDYISHREKLPTRKKNATKVIDIKECREVCISELNEEEAKIVALLATIFVKNVLASLNK